MGELTQTQGTAVAMDEEIAQLIAQNERAQKAELAEASSADYILLAKPATKALKRSSDKYIDGLSIDDFYIQKSKTVLGKDLFVVPLMFMTVYNEMDSSDINAKMLGIWAKEQAEQYPLVEGSFYNHKLPNGHILVPSNWVAVELLRYEGGEVTGHLDVEFGVVAYKSTGSRIWRAWKKDVKSRAGSSATLVYHLASEEQHGSKGDWTDIGFTFAGNLLELSKIEAIHCLKKSNELHEAYDKHFIVPLKEVDTKAIESTTAESLASEVAEDDDLAF